IAAAVGLTAQPHELAGGDEPTQETRQTPAGRGEGPAELALVPADAVGFVRIAVRDLLGSPALNDARAQAGQGITEGLKEMETNLGVGIEDLDSILLIMLAPAEAVHEPSLLVAYTTIRPFEREKVKQAIAPSGEFRVHRGKSYFQSGDLQFSGLYF